MGAFRKHVYTVDGELWRGCDAGVVRQTANDLREMGLWRLPHPDGVFLRISDERIAEGTPVTIGIDECGPLGEPDARIYLYMEVPRGAASKSKWKHVSTGFAKTLSEEGGHAGDKVVINRRRSWISADKPASEDLQYFADFLVVLLATRGVVKETSSSKLAKLGIGKSRPQTTTTLRLDRTLTDAAGNVAGRHVRPHLRRGHIRNQRYGPEMSLSKKIWIGPCMVNVDVDAEPAPRPYVIKGRLPAELSKFS
jgi:hypothetical protein